MKAATPNKRGVSKGLGNDRVFNKLVSNIENDITHIDERKVENMGNWLMQQH